MAFDYSIAPEQRGTELIPDGTVATLQMSIRPGGAGDRWTPQALQGRRLRDARPRTRRRRRASG